MKFTRLATLGIALCSTAIVHAAERSTLPAGRLNVLVIMSDDLNDAIGAYGNRIVQTPNLDRLAARGVMFDRAYCQFPLCNPSRASTFTGRRPDAIGVWDLETHFRFTTPDLVTLPELFRRHGYRVVRAGKIYHYGVPGEIGTPGLDDPVSWEATANPRGRDKREEAKAINFTPQRAPTGLLGNSLAYLVSEGTDEEQTDGKVATATIKFIEEAGDRPFFIAAGFFRPHTPFIAPKRYFDLYPLEAIPLPGDPTESLKLVPPAALFTKPAFLGLTSEQQRIIIRAYYASVTFMDAQVGRVLDALEKRGLTDKTLVVFLSDHGYMLGEHGQWMKQNLFEESVRTPLIVAGPGIKSGVTAREIVEFVDIYPTVIDYAGFTSTEPLAGRSLRPILAGTPRSWPNEAFSQVGRSDSLNHGGISIRTDRWRYNEWGVDAAQGRELYDHQNDPSEQHNLAADSAHQDVVRELSARLRQHFCSPSVRPRADSKGE